MPTPTNRYCERLGVPVPRLADVVQRPGMTLSQLAAVVLLEHGRPLSLQEIAARLARAGLPEEIRFDPEHHGLGSTRRWPGPAFQPERFDVRDVNRRLRLW